MVDGVGRALRLGICGMTAHDERAARRVERFAHLADGTFVWTRDPDGGYFLGRLDGPLVHDGSDEAIAVGLTEVRTCSWTDDPVPEVDVPPATLQTFARGGRNFQQTHHPDVWEQSLAVWQVRRPGVW